MRYRTAFYKHVHVAFSVMHRMKSYGGVEVCVLPTYLETIQDRNATDALVVNDELLLLILKAFAHSTRSINATRNARRFQYV